MTKTVAVSDKCHKQVKIAAAELGIEIQEYVEKKLCTD